MSEFTRRKFCIILAAFGTSFAAIPVFTSKAGALLVNTDASFEQARKLFALTIAFQQDGDTMRARVNAKKCLQLLKHLDTAKETAAGNVVAAGNCIICEPSHLHTDTALQRFRSEGICV